MRWLYLGIIVVFGVLTAAFAIQNRGSVEVSLLSFSVRAPLALQILGFYVVGAITGSSLFALLRQSYRKAKASTSA